jgi:hypothetical protein
MNVNKPQVLSLADPEPNSGSVIKDGFGERWIHDSEGLWWCSSRAADSEYWGNLASGHGKLTLLSSGRSEVGRPSYERVLAAARRVVMASSPVISAWELDPSRMDIDGEELHRELRQALGISEAEWRHSPTRTKNRSNARAIGSTPSRSARRALVANGSSDLTARRAAPQR